MRDDERRALEQVRNEHRYVFDLLSKRAADESGEAVLQNLEATYLIRLYATFEAVLRFRIGIAVDDESTLENLIQRLSGEEVGYDPVNAGRAIAWWRLFRRDRNQLAHGRSLIPAIGLDATRGLMEEYLARPKD